LWHRRKPIHRFAYHESMPHLHLSRIPATGQSRPSRQRTAAAIAVAAFISALPEIALSQTQAQLPEVTVKDVAERADGPVQGYRAGRSATFTKTDTPLKEVPASVTIVPTDLMKDQAMQSMADVFRYVPGALTHQGESNRDQVVLRGNTTSADFFVDGVRDDAQVFRDLYNVERVEVLKGPGGMAFGRGGAGGVVNRVTKMPIFGKVGEASVTAGSERQLRGTVDVGNKASETLAWRLNAMAENADSFRDGVELKRYAINPTLTFMPGASTAFTVGYEHLDDRRTADRGNPSFNGLPFLINRNTFFGNADQSTAESKVDGLYAILSHELASGSQLKNTFRITHYDKFYQNVYPGSAVSAAGAAGTLTISGYNNYNRRTNTFNQTDLVTRLVAGGIEHRLLTGIELGHQDSFSRRNDAVFGAATFQNLPNVPAANPVATASRFAPNPNGSSALNRVKSNIFAAYVQDQMALSKDWKLLAGLRYDRFKVDSDDQRVVVGATPLTDLSRTDSEFSPRVGLIWSPSNRQSYYASYSYSFLPSGETLSLASTTANLAPEQAKNYELGAHWDLQPNLQLSAAVFRTDKDNVRVADPVNLGSFLKSGKQRVTGFELGLQGDVTSNWQVYGGYTDLNARILQPISSGTSTSVGAIIPAGRKLALVPEHALSVWNKVNLGAGVGAALGVIRQSDSFATISNAVKLPAFTRIDAALYYTFADAKTRLALNVENLADKTYFPTAHADNNITVGTPRTVRLTLATRF
jgi:catecholate siderophore receptor